MNILNKMIFSLSFTGSKAMYPILMVKIEPWSQYALGLSTMRQMRTIDSIKQTFKTCEQLISDPMNDLCLSQVFNDDYFWLK